MSYLGTHQVSESRHILKIGWGRLCFIAAAFFSGNGFAQDYSYSDGSANTYRIAPGKLEYIPVKKENSSSVTYTGGTAKTVKLSDVDYRSLSALLEEGIAAKSLQTDRRVMMSGVIRRSTKDDKTVVILKPGVRVKDQIEAKLLELANRGE